LRPRLRLCSVRIPEKECTSLLACKSELWMEGGRKEGEESGRKDGRKEGEKEGRKVSKESKALRVELVQ
jgi:hypothetical protein